jgi:hypothetical protein
MVCDLGDMEPNVKRGWCEERNSEKRWVIFTFDFAFTKPLGIHKQDEVRLISVLE